MTVAITINPSDVATAADFLEHAGGVLAVGVSEPGWRDSDNAGHRGESPRGRPGGHSLASPAAVAAFNVAPVGGADAFAVVCPAGFCCALGCHVHRLTRKADHFCLGRYIR